jgi:hypothetical protein
MADEVSEVYEEPVIESVVEETGVCSGPDVSILAESDAPQPDGLDGGASFEPEGAEAFRFWTKECTLPATEYVSSPVSALAPTTPLDGEAHLFFAPAIRILVKENWPLAGYFVYMDADTSNAIDFNRFGLLWTDERGTVHETQSGKPVRPLTNAPCIWSQADGDQSGERVSLALIYDSDLNALNRRRANIEKSGERTPSSPEHRITRMQWSETALDNFSELIIYAPADEEALPLEKLEALMRRCEALFKPVDLAREKIDDFLSNLVRKAVCFNQFQIEWWLSGQGDRLTELERRRHLWRINDRLTTWSSACCHIPGELKKLKDTYESTLEPLLRLLKDDSTLKNIDLIDLVLRTEDDRSGIYFSWKHQFYSKAFMAFAGTCYRDEIFRQFVEPYLQILTTRWQGLREGCNCDTCQSVRKFSEQPPTDHSPELRGTPYKSKDLKLGVDTLARILELFTSFLPNLATLIAGRKYEPTSEFFFFLVRTGVIRPEANNADAATQWVELIGKLKLMKWREVDRAAEWTGSLNEFLKEKLAPSVDTARISAVFNGLAGTILLQYVLIEAYKNRRLSDKNRMEFAQALAYLGRSGSEFGKGWVQKQLTSLILAQAGTKPTDMAEKLAAEKVALELAKDLAATLPRVLSLLGAALDLASVGTSLAESTDEREFGWYSVQLLGSDMALGGSLAGIFPEPLVSKAGAGVAAGVGGLIYLYGKIMLVLTKPGFEEGVLRAGKYYFDEGSPLSATDQAEYERLRRDYDMRETNRYIK